MKFRYNSKHTDGSIVSLEEIVLFLKARTNIGIFHNRWKALGCDRSIQEGANRNRNFPVSNSNKFSRNVIAASSFPRIYILDHLHHSISINNMKIEVLDIIMIILSDTFNTGMLIMPCNGIWSRNYVVIKADVCGYIYKKVIEYFRHSGSICNGFTIFI